MIRPTIHDDGLATYFSPTVIQKLEQGEMIYTCPDLLELSQPDWTKLGFKVGTKAKLLFLARVSCGETQPFHCFDEIIGEDDPNDEDARLLERITNPNAVEAPVPLKKEKSRPPRPFLSSVNMKMMQTRMQMTQTKTVLTTETIEVTAVTIATNDLGPEDDEPRVQAAPVEVYTPPSAAARARARARACGRAGTGSPPTLAAPADQDALSVVEIGARARARTRACGKLPRAGWPARGAAEHGGAVWGGPDGAGPGQPWPLQRQHNQDDGQAHGAGGVVAARDAAHAYPGVARLLMWPAALLCCTCMDPRGARR
eukprot:CAMPEP_0177654414 /NCGR_PEP_ID=MMETSP0447-20121125/14318_1 /TAXON_ID=0 /ORGANISM="Stygamoeba regulata, Strain BSH-02190019" /LENGTH=312 /DNA_ID=CAMNT_0019158059 /DNA_START=52 /DNA_END=986 /DNA_ORIENTATION=+